MADVFLDLEKGASGSFDKGPAAAWYWRLLGFRPNRVHYQGGELERAPGFQSGQMATILQKALFPLQSHAKAVEAAMIATRNHVL